MKKLTGILSLFMLMVMTAAAQKKPHPKMTINNVTGNYYVVTSYGYPDDKNPFPANALLVLTDAGAVLVDTPWDEEETKQLVDTVYRRWHQKIELCVATHFHSDRTAGLELLKRQGTKTYTSVLTYSLAQKHHEKLPEFTFKCDTTFTVGSIGLKVYYPGAGHTTDNIVVWFPQDKVLYGGCLFKSLDTNSIGNTADADLKHWQATIENVIKFYGHAAYVVPGHEGWTGSIDILSHTMDVVESAAK